VQKIRRLAKQYFFAYTLQFNRETSKENIQIMMRISRKIEIDYGHTLPNSFSFCNQLHGHRGVVVATIEGRMIDRKGDGEEGMVMDFKFLKEIMQEHIHDKLDHGFAVWKEDHEDLDFILNRNSRVLVTDAPPTAESLALWAFNQIRPHLPVGVTLKQIRWYETPNNWADYEGNDLQE
jgi:6-pyruvoyltetrahydropterin/6-carboxytetrahydropterin synthase